MSEIPVGLSDYLREEFACRAEIGASFWSIHPTNGSMRCYSYCETIAIAHMMNKGWSMDDAASILDADLVIAVPYVPGVESARIGVPNFVYGVGKSLLTDGAIWDVLGDLDLPHAQDIIQDGGFRHGATAIRNFVPSDDNLELRISQLVTTGEFNAEGRFVADHHRATRATEPAMAN